MIQTAMRESPKEEFFSTFCVMPSSVRRTAVIEILKSDRIEAVLHVV
jgi:hypothetical protein